jgi:uncharacterized membrane protein
MVMIKMKVSKGSIICLIFAVISLLNCFINLSSTANLTTTIFAVIDWVSFAIWMVLATQYLGVD